MVSKNKREDGFASLVITLVLVLVVTLIVVGFAQMSRHEQQQALGNLLANQAYYAAETGVNDVAKYILAGNSLPGENSNQCMSLADLKNNLGTSNVLSGSSANQTPSYTCVMVTNTPKGLKATVAVNTGYSFYVEPSAPISSLTVNWKSSGTTSTTPRSPAASNSARNFPSVAGWGAAPPLLQVSIFPVAGGGTAALASANTNYLYPDTGTDNPTLSTNANILHGNCGAAHSVEGVNYQCATKYSVSGSGPFIVHVVSLYDSSEVAISANDGAVSFNNSQAVIDVTGKAQNVLKRIKVHVNLSKYAGSNGEFAIEAKNICKRFGSMPGSATDSSITGDTHYYEAVSPIQRIQTEYKC